jgi:sorting nexin-4
MHQHIAHPPNPDQNNGLIDNISDTLLNAFSKVRKPDERFLAMRENVDKFEEGLVLSERLWNRVRSRTNGKSDFACPIYFSQTLRLNETIGTHWVKI